MKTITRCLLLCGAFVACADEEVDDGGLHETDESAVTLANGQPTCANPNKQVVCHGEDPHAICVSLQAIESHVIDHGDLVGPCP